MTVFQCIVMTKDETRCLKTTETNLPVSPNFRYVCSHHTREEQLQVLSRPYDPVKDEADRDDHFQDSQFEDDLARTPIFPLVSTEVHGSVYRRGHLRTPYNEGLEHLGAEVEIPEEN